jgi:uncharacterized membrane protein
MSQEYVLKRKITHKGKDFEIGATITESDMHKNILDKLVSKDRAEILKKDKDDSKVEDAEEKSKKDKEKAKK